ncbi:DNA pilot protein [Sigmofec virus UA08Rod_4626]|uniref:DNA pilot protein n=1 Tax=Sigmofec virus UA08Rod_4626 TaxID=2929405 RepID=A0A976R8M9_9VIRU|nr:DNA pilot protein [Sigmofec virus UA08Rod_4626]
MGKIFDNVLSGVSTFGGLGSAIGSFLAGSANNRFQAQQAQLNREFQSLENQKSRDFSLRMWNMNNQYNDPSAVVERLRMAGLNKSLMYGGSNGITPATSVPVGSGASGAMPNTTNPLSPELARTVAETRLINSQADKLDSETIGQMTFNKFSEQLYQGQIDYQGVQIRVGSSVAGVNDAQKTVLYRSLNKLDAEVRNINADTDLKRSVSDINALEIDWLEVRNSHKNSYWGTTISKLESEAKISRQEAETFMISLTSALALQYSERLLNDKKSETELALYTKLSNEASNLEKYGVRLDVENGRLQIQLDLDKDYAEAERVINMIVSGLGGVADVFNVVNLMKPKRSTTTTTTDRNMFGSRTTTESVHY